jgi:hypothetical protein
MDVVPKTKASQQSTMLEESTVVHRRYLDERARVCSS